MSKYKYEGYGVIRDTEIDFPYYTDDIVELLDEKDQNIANLEAKLAEKEKQLENAQNLKAIEVADELSLKLSKIHNQDKISFAVEQLEKVKKFFLEEHRDEEMDTDYIITKDAGEIADYLLDQIKQLKEMK